MSRQPPNETAFHPPAETNAVQVLDGDKSTDDNGKDVVVQNDVTGLGTVDHDGPVRQTDL